MIPEPTPLPPCDSSLGGSPGAAVLQQQDHDGYYFTVDAAGNEVKHMDPMVVVRHQGVVKVAESRADYMSKVNRFTARTPLIRRTARPIFITRQQLLNLLYQHEGTHCLQLYFGLALQQNGVDVATWEWQDSHTPAPTLDFRLIMVPAKFGAPFEKDSTPAQEACHFLLPPYQVYEPNGAHYDWQPIDLAGRDALVANQVHLWPFNPDPTRPLSCLIGRYRLFHDVLQNYAMIRIEPLLYNLGGIMQLGIIMAGVNSMTGRLPNPRPADDDDTPGDHLPPKKPNVYWTLPDGANNGAYCTLPGPPRGGN